MWSLGRFDLKLGRFDRWDDLTCGPWDVLMVGRFDLKLGRFDRWDDLTCAPWDVLTVGRFDCKPLSVCLSHTGIESKRL